MRNPFSTRKGQLWREQGSDIHIAMTLAMLSIANQAMGLYKEGIQQVEEALEISERLGNTMLQAQRFFSKLALLLGSDEQFDAAEGATFRAINLFPEKGQEYFVCESHQMLGLICISNQGRDRESCSPFRGSPRNCDSFQLARSPGFDPFKPGKAVSR